MVLKKEKEVVFFDEEGEEFLRNLAYEFEREEFKREFDEFWEKIENIGMSLRTPKYKKDVLISFGLLVAYFLVGYLIGLAA